MIGLTNDDKIAVVLGRGDVGIAHGVHGVTPFIKFIQLGKAHEIGADVMDKQHHDLDIPQIALFFENLRGLKILERAVFETRTYLEIVLPARDFAREIHKSQVRKYTGEPYFSHLEEVAMLVAQHGGTPEMIAAAYLHDCVEDQGVDPAELSVRFGPKVQQYVVELTDVSRPSDGNREVRKRLDRLHTASISPEAKSIKCADLTSNTASIVERDPEFAKVYLEEKRLLLQFALGDASIPALYQLALEKIPTKDNQHHEM